MREWLMQKQTILGEKDKAFAARIGWARSTWEAIRNNRRGIGRDLLSKVVVAFPELERVPSFILLSDSTSAEAIAAYVDAPQAEPCNV